MNEVKPKSIATVQEMDHQESNQLYQYFKKLMPKNGDQDTYRGAITEVIFNRQYRKKIFSNLENLSNFSDITNQQEKNKQLLEQKNILILAIITEAFEFFSENISYTPLDIEELINKLCPLTDTQSKIFLHHCIYQAIDHLDKLKGNKDKRGHLSKERLKVIDTMLAVQKNNPDFAPKPKNDKNIPGHPPENEDPEPWHQEIDSYKKELRTFLNRMSTEAARLHEEKRTDLFAHIWIEKIGNQDNPQFLLKSFGLADHPSNQENEPGFDHTPLEITLVLSPSEAYEILRLQNLQTGNAKEMVKRKTESLFIERMLANQKPINSWQDWTNYLEPQSQGGLPLVEDQSLHLMLHGWGGTPFAWDELIENNILELQRLEDPTLNQQIWLSLGLQGSLSSTPDFILDKNGNPQAKKIEQLTEAHLINQPIQALKQVTDNLNRLHQRVGSIRDADNHLVVPDVFGLADYDLTSYFILTKSVKGEPLNLDKKQPLTNIEAGPITFSVDESLMIQEALAEHHLIVDPALKKINQLLRKNDQNILKFLAEVLKLPLTDTSNHPGAVAAIDRWKLDYTIDQSLALSKERLKSLAKELLGFLVETDLESIHHQIDRSVKVVGFDVADNAKELSARETLNAFRNNQPVDKQTLNAAINLICELYPKIFSRKSLSQAMKEKDGRAWFDLCAYLDRDVPMKQKIIDYLKYYLENTGIEITPAILEKVDQLWQKIKNTNPDSIKTHTRKVILYGPENPGFYDKELSAELAQEVFEEWKKQQAKIVDQQLDDFSIENYQTQIKQLKQSFTLRDQSLAEATNIWQKTIEQILLERSKNIETDIELFTKYKAEKAVISDQDYAQDRPEANYRIKQLKALAKLAGWNTTEYDINNEEFLKQIWGKKLLSQELGESRLLAKSEIAINQHLLNNLTEIFGHSMGGKIARALGLGLSPNNESGIISPLANLYRSLDVSPTGLQIIASNEVINGSRLSPEEVEKVMIWLKQAQNDHVILHAGGVGGLLARGKSVLDNPLINFAGRVFGIERSILLWYMGKLKSATDLVLHEYVYDQPNKVQQRIGSHILRNMPFVIENDEVLTELRWIANRGITVAQIAEEDNILHSTDVVITNSIIAGRDAIAIRSGAHHYPEADELGRALAIMRVLRRQPDIDEKDVKVDWRTILGTQLVDKNGKVLLNQTELEQVFPRISSLNPKEHAFGLISPEQIKNMLKERLKKKTA